MVGLEGLGLEKRGKTGIVQSLGLRGRRGLLLEKTIDCCRMVGWLLRWLSVDTVAGGDR